MQISLINCKAANSSIINKNQNQYLDQNYKSKNVYHQDTFEKTNKVHFTGEPSFLLFENIAKEIKVGHLDFIEKLADHYIINEELKSLLHISAEEGQVKISKFLLDKGLDVNQKDKLGKSPFLISCLGKNEELFDLFLGYKPNLNIMDAEGNTPLHNAIHNRKYLEALLDEGANPYLKDAFGLPVLHEAAVDLDTVDYLIKLGVSPDSINEEEQTLLHTSAIDGNKNLAELLIKNKAEIDFKDREGKSPIFYAKDGSIIKYFIAKGANPNIQDKQGRTPLFDYVQKNDINSVLELLKGGANVNIADNESKTVLLYASNNSIRKVLLAYGANPNVKTSNGSTLLHMAVQKDNEEVAKTMLEYKADVNALDTNEKTPLYYSKNNAIRRLLLEKGANPNDELYLHNAIKTDNDDFLDSLLASPKIDTNMEDANSKTPIFYCKKPEQVTKLLGKKAYLDYQDNSGNTPLHHCYASGNLEMASLLKKLGANTEIKNNKGESPIDLMEKYKKYFSWVK